MGYLWGHGRVGNGSRAGTAAPQPADSSGCQTSRIRHPRADLHSGVMEMHADGICLDAQPAGDLGRAVPIHGTCPMEARPPYTPAKETEAAGPSHVRQRLRIAPDISAAWFSLATLRASPGPMGRPLKAPPSPAERVTKPSPGQAAASSGTTAGFDKAVSEDVAWIGGVSFNAVFSEASFEGLAVPAWPR
jgi:hypothetical protein